MTKKITLILFFLLFFFFKNFSQTNWNPIKLNVAGHNTLSGVEASYQVNTCNGDDVVFVKLVNHNAYSVTVEWYPGVFTKELNWIRKENPSDKISVTVNPNAELAGDCSGANQTMMIRLKDFSVDVTNFNMYGTSDFTVSSK